MIDEIGGYYDAVELAKALAGIEGEVEIVEYPKKVYKKKLKALLDIDTKFSVLPDVILESIYAVPKVSNNPKSELKFPIAISILLLFIFEL